nr:MAG TPA: hypothetical protein [Caudoviricetes sp.]
MILIDDMEALYKKSFDYCCDNYQFFTDKSKYGNKFTIRDNHRGQIIQFIQLNTPYKIAVEYHKDDDIFVSRQYLMDSTQEAFVDVALWGFETVANNDYGHKEFSRIVTSRDEIICAINSAYKHVRCGDSENEKVFPLHIMSRVYAKVDFYFYLDDKNVLWFKASKKHTREPIQEKRLGAVGGSYDDAFTYNDIHECVREFLGHMVKVALDQ